MWIYTTPAVTSHVYGTTDTTSALYNEGANWVGVAFGMYNGVAAVAAFAIPVLARRTNRKMAHAVCLVCGAIGLLSILLLKDPRLLLGFIVGRFFGGQAIYALAVGGASLLLAAGLTLRVDDRDDTTAGTWHPGFPPSV
jgi:maltose/moltooligosaccharide transporter